MSAFDRTWLDSGVNAFNRDEYDRAQAAAIIGLLTALADNEDKHDREEFLDKKWTEADDALGRVLEVADRLDALTFKTILKPEGYAGVARRIREAVHGEAATDADS